MIDIQGVRKVFPGQAGGVIALDGIDLTIRQGDIFGIIGMSGAGKSTLIRCINRLEAPTEGRIVIGGQDILEASRRDLLTMRRSVGMIFQQFNLLMQRTVEKNVRFPMEISGVPHEAAKRRASELLELVGLRDKARVYPAQLSGGQKQRVAIARALATNPGVLLCDEATSALDPMTTQSILSLLQDINQRLGITIVIITHEMQVIRQICTHVAIIDNGRIAEQGDVTEIFTNPQTAASRKLFRLAANDAVSGG
ncbi:MAG: ATP-binding cassette domain-containing protein, partial [Firmicutes bacterium]|nr:ATP-binding cassette domain-containing protein [Bacillota bacterium]